MRLVVIAVFLVGFTFGSASAERGARGKVDWSQYLEKPGDRVPKKATPSVAADSGKKVKKPRAAAKRPAKANAKRKVGRRR